MGMFGRIKDAANHKMPHPAVEYGPHHQQSSDEIVWLTVFGGAVWYVGGKSAGDPLWAYEFLANLPTAMWGLVGVLSLLPLLLVFELERQHRWITIGSVMWILALATGGVLDYTDYNNGLASTIYGIIALLIIATLFARVTLTTLHLWRRKELRAPMLARALRGMSVDRGRRREVHTAKKNAAKEAAQKHERGLYEDMANAGAPAPARRRFRPETEPPASADPADEAVNAKASSNEPLVGKIVGGNGQPNPTMAFERPVPASDPNPAEADPDFGDLDFDNLVHHFNDPVNHSH